MIERVHEHIISELKQNTWTDIIFVLTAILLNLLSLGVNSGVAAGGWDEPTTATIIMVFFILLVIVVNFVVIIGLQRGKQTREKLIQGLLKMYSDQGVAGYYDDSLVGNYSVRYNLFILTVVVTGIVSVAVPMVIRLVSG
jgi:hypothetical protein